MLFLYEILVPTLHSDGRPIKTRFHRVWDSRVREITNGLTVLNPVKGQWVNGNGKLFSERMIPVRIMCSATQIEDIADMTAKYYDQEAVMFWKVSDGVRIKIYAKKETTARNRGR